MTICVVCEELVEQWTLDAAGVCRACRARAQAIRDGDADRADMDWPAAPDDLPV